MSNHGRTAIVTYTATFTKTVDLSADETVSEAVSNLEPGTGKFIEGSLSIIKIIGPEQPTGEVERG